MPYPQNRKAWRRAIQEALGLSPEMAESAYRSGSFPFDQLVEWLERTFSQGYSREFVPALLRNRRGLVDWIYGDGDEPYWPGSDSESPEPA